MGDAAVVRLNPSAVSADGEWETWFFANWIPGACVYPSFEKSLHEEIAVLCEWRNDSNGRRCRKTGGAPRRTEWMGNTNMPHTTHRLSFRSQLTAMAGVLFFSGALFAQTPAWLPLEVGNTWLYRPADPTRPTGKDYRSIAVLGTENIGGQTYFDVNWLGREVLLRNQPSDGAVLVYDAASKIEKIWVAPGLPAGSTFPASANACPATGSIAARDAAVSTPVGDFTNAVEVHYTNCVDVGVIRQFYVAGVGLIEDDEFGLGGAQKYELVYYRVGPQTGARPELAFTLALDAPRYSGGASVQARLTLRNTTAAPVRLVSGGQAFDLEIRDVHGNTVYRWSNGRVFPMYLRDELFTGERTYGATAPLDGLAPGHYTAVGYLTTQPLLYRAQVGFDIVAGQPKL